MRPWLKLTIFFQGPICKSVNFPWGREKEMEDDEKPLFARAAGGVSSSVIKTSNTGLNTGFITLPCGDAPFIVRPKQEGNCPVILLAHEIFGLHELILDLAHHLARGGAI